MAKWAARKETTHLSVTKRTPVFVGASGLGLLAATILDWGRFRTGRARPLANPFTENADDGIFRNRPGIGQGDLHRGLADRAKSHPARARIGHGQEMTVGANHLNRHRLSLRFVAANPRVSPPNNAVLRRKPPNVHSKLAGPQRLRSIPSPKTARSNVMITVFPDPA